MLFGHGIGFAIVYSWGSLLMKPRGWAKHSGWLQPEPGGSMTPKTIQLPLDISRKIFLYNPTRSTPAQTVDSELLNPFLFHLFFNSNNLSRYCYRVCLAMWDEKEHRQRHTSTVGRVKEYLKTNQSFGQNRSGSPGHGCPRVPRWFDSGSPIPLDHPRTKCTFGCGLYKSNAIGKICIRALSSALRL